MANKFAKNDEAVSAVIGVILMVAITVILAAVIAAFVFGMGQNVKKTYTVAFTTTRSSSTEIAVTNNGGNDVGKLSTIAVSIDGTPAGSLGGLTTAVGSSGNFATSTPSGSGTHVVVTGTFADGVSQVLLDTYV